jgi:hypothetical protein
VRIVKLFEDFNTLQFIINQVKGILRPLTSFYYNNKVEIEESSLFITISKNTPDRIKVFHTSDILPTLKEVNEYLTLGESFRLDEVFVQTINGEIELSDIESLKTVSGIVVITMIYKM